MIPDLMANMVTDITIGGGYQSNLFNDSNSLSDKYAAVDAKLKYYPATSTRFAVAASYNAFSSYKDLSNFTGEASVTFVPTSETSALTVVLGTNLSVRKFGTTYEPYNQQGKALSLQMSYRLTQWANLLSSAAYLDNRYSNSDFGSNRGLNLNAGINFTIAGSNSIALKWRYYNRSFDQPTIIQESAGQGHSAEQVISETFGITEIALRLSRPLGKRTGMNLSIGHRQLHLANDYTVPGYTIDYLSPWADLWEGVSLSGGVKHFFPNQWISQLTFAYNDKRFIDVVEIGEDTSDTYRMDNRDDQLISLSLIISRPLSMQNSKQLTPSFHLDYIKNNSSSEYFNYDNIQASIGLKLSL